MYLNCYFYNLSSLYILEVINNVNYCGFIGCVGGQRYTHTLIHGNCITIITSVILGLTLIVTYSCVDG